MATPTVGVLPFGFLIGVSPFGKDDVFLAGVALVGCEKSDAAVFVPIVVPTFKVQNPFSGFGEVLESLDGKAGAVFAGSENRFGIGIVVADPGPATGRGDSQFVQGLQKGRAFHRTAVI